MNLLETPLSDKRLSAQLLPPPPLENDTTPFTKNRRLVPGFSCSTGWGSLLGSACQQNHQIMGTTSRGAANCRGMLGLSVGRVASFSKFEREAEQKVKHLIWD